MKLRCTFDRRASHGHPMQVGWTGQDSGTRGEGGMSNGHPMDVPWTGGLDRTVGQAWSVRVGCPMDVHWTGGTSRDKPGQ